jgi:hypothetical protein
MAAMSTAVLVAIGVVELLSGCASNKPPPATPSATKAIQAANTSPATPAVSSAAGSVPPSISAVPAARALITPDPPVTRIYNVTSNGQSGGITGGEVHIHPVDRQPDNSEVEKLRETIRLMQEYSVVAKLGMDGTLEDTEPPLSRVSDISKSLNGAIVRDGTEHRISCDDKSLQALRDTAARFPMFPFSFFGLAYCLQRSGNSLWAVYALKAVDVLNRTTMVPDRHPAHSAVLSQLNDALSQMRLGPLREPTSMTSSP